MLDLIGLWRSDRNPFGRAALLDAQAVTIPVGTILKWASTQSVPSGWLKCEGQSVSKATYANLYAKIGDTFGSTATTFKLPDYRRRTSVGAGGTRPAGSSGPGAALGNTGGAETVTITVGQMARHSHGLNLSLSSAGSHAHKVGETWNRHANDSLNDGSETVCANRPSAVEHGGAWERHRRGSLPPPDRECRQCRAGIAIARRHRVPHGGGDLHSQDMR